MESGSSEPRAAAPAAVVVMGVAGCGKSTLGAALARALGARFVEGDALHPPQNVARMAAGEPLTDEHRAGWLNALAGELAASRARGEPVVLACSALKRRYRDVLRRGAPELSLVFLHGREGLLRERIAARRGHYMPASLLPSQLEALEPPGEGEAAVHIDIASAADEALAAALRGLGRGAAARHP
jgi:gluconokinase